VAARQSGSEVKLWLQKFRYAATGRWAVSIRTYLALVFPFGYLTSIEREQQFHDISVSHAAGIALGGELVCALYLFVVQAVLLGNRRNQLQPLWRVVFVWVSTGLVRGFFTACNANWGSGFNYEFVKRVPVAAVYTASAMALTAYYFGTIDRRRLESKALKSLETILAQEQSGLTELQRERRKQAQQVFDEQLLPQVNALRNGIDRLLAKNVSEKVIDGGALSGLYEQSREISSAIEDQMQAYEGTSEAQIVSEGMTERFSYIKALLPTVVSIRITFMLMVLGSFSGQFARNGWAGALAGFVGAIVVVIYLLPISQALKKTQLDKRLLYTLAYVGSFVVQASYNLVQPTIGFHLPNPYQPWYSGLKTMYGVFVASVIATLIVSVEGDFSGRKDVGLQLRNKVDQLADENESLQYQLVHSQYGTLQGKITGVTMALHLMNSMGSISQERRSELLSGANALLDESLREIEKLRVGAQ
jgi:hypothetical protein